MNNGISLAVGTASSFYMKNKAVRSYIAGLASVMRENAVIRRQYEKEGVHVPPYLIASIASQCNLHCMGCYARAGGVCDAHHAEQEMDAGQWERIFKEAAQLGVSFILLAGGEPLLRKDVIETAARFKRMVFPVFTNGTMITGNNLTLFDQNRNIIPVLSIEGSAEETDSRRGEGVSAVVDEAMKRLNRLNILFGVSVTVTNRNKYKVTDARFLRKLSHRGCGLVFFVEYVPAESGTEELVLSPDACKVLNDRVGYLRRKLKQMIIVSFPGDEEKMGGCLAAGRGFFHINPSGGAEPCPFAPFSKLSLKDTPILEVLKSDYFEKLRELELNAKTHKGGCTLFEILDQVEQLASQ